MASRVVPLRELLLAEDLKYCVFVRSSPLQGKQNFVFNFNEEEMSHIFSSLNIFLKDSEGNRLEVDNITPDCGVLCSVNILGGQSFNNVINRATSIFPNGGIEDVINFLLGSEVKVTCKDGNVEQGIIVSCRNTSPHVSGFGQTPNTQKQEITLFCTETKSISSFDYENVTSIIPTCKTKLEEFEYYLSALPMIQQGKNWQVLINSEVKEGNYSIHCEYSVPIKLDSKIYYQLDTRKSKLSCRILLTNSTMESWENIIVKTNSREKTNPSSKVSILPGYSSMILSHVLDAKYSLYHAPSSKYVKFTNTTDVAFNNGELMVVNGDSIDDRYVVDSAFSIVAKGSKLLNLHEPTKLEFKGTKTDVVTTTKKTICLVDDGSLPDIHKFKEVKTTITNKNAEINITNPTDKPLKGCMSIPNSRTGFSFGGGAPNSFTKNVKTTCSVSHKIKYGDIFFTVAPNETVKVTFSEEKEGTINNIMTLTEEWLDLISNSLSTTTSESYKNIRNLLEVSLTLKNMKSKSESLQNNIRKEFGLYDKLTMASEKEKLSSIIENLASEERAIREEMETVIESIKELRKKLCHDVISLTFDALPTETTCSYKGSNPSSGFTKATSRALPATTSVFGNTSGQSSLFGSSCTSGSSFGSSRQTLFGTAVPSSSSGFGASTAFGAPRTSLFGASSSPFGGTASHTTSTPFGGTNSHTAGTFGGTSTFGGNNNSLASNPFGSSTRSSFSQPRTEQSQGGLFGSVRGDSGETITAVTASPALGSTSFEELRNHYLKTGQALESSTNTSSESNFGGNSFGSVAPSNNPSSTTSNNASTGSPFSSTPSTNTSSALNFGGNSFGYASNNPSSTTSTNVNNGSPFASTGSSFSSSAAYNSSNVSTFGSTQNTTSTGFGSTFGNSGATSPFSSQTNSSPNPSGGFLFGASTPATEQKTTSGFSFGAPKEDKQQSPSQSNSSPNPSSGFSFAPQEDSSPSGFSFVPREEDKQQSPSSAKSGFSFSDYNHI